MAGDDEHVVEATIMVQIRREKLKVEGELLADGGGWGDDEGRRGLDWMCEQGGMRRRLADDGQCSFLFFLFLFLQPAAASSPSAFFFFSSCLPLFLSAFLHCFSVSSSSRVRLFTRSEEGGDIRRGWCDGIGEVYGGDNRKLGNPFMDLDGKKAERMDAEMGWIWSPPSDGEAAAQGGRG